MSDVDFMMRNRIKNFKEAGRSVSWIVEEVGVSRSTVYNVLRNRNTARQQQIADRYEALSQGGFSGNYHNGEQLPTNDVLHAGDPLDLLILMEELESRL